MIHPSLNAIINRYPRLSMTTRPVPIQRLDGISRMLNSNIYCMRDDLTGFAFGGSKIRKLDYLIREVIDLGYDTIVTSASNQSNWCRVAAAAGAMNGVDVHLVLGGARPERDTGNLLLDRLVGAKIQHLEPDDDDLLAEACDDLVKELNFRGRKACHVPSGGSTPLGAVGNIDAFAEILEFERSHGISFSKIFVATGSGGAQVAFIISKTLTGWQGDIIGITISRSAAEQRNKLLKQIRHTEEVLGIVSKSGESLILADDSYLGPGYRERTSDAHDAIELFARTEGIFLDEVYTGKAAAGLVDYGHTGRFDSEEHVLFVHSGGNTQLFE